jgi:hypothetical protein
MDRAEEKRLREILEKAKMEAEEAKREAEKAKREAEIEHQKALKLHEETQREIARTQRGIDRMRIRTTAKREEPDGTIGGIVKTEWGTFFNIRQTPS